MSTRDDLNEQPFDITQMPVGNLTHRDSVTVDPTVVVPALIHDPRHLNHVVWSGGTIDYVGLARRYALWLVCGMISGVLLGHVIFRTYGPEFTATAKVLVSKRMSGPTSESSEAETWGDRAEHIALIMSPLIVEKAVKLHDLDRLPSMAQSNDPAEDVLDSIKVKRSAGEDRSFLNVLDVTCTNPNREDAKKICHAVIDAYRVYLRENHEENTGELLNLVNRATGDLKGQIDETELAYKKFRLTAPIHMKTGTRAASGERTSAATNVHQENLEALEQEQQRLLVQKADVQSKIQSLEQSLKSGQSREELATMIQLFSAPQSKAAQTPSILGPGGSQSTLDGQLLPLLLQEKQLLLEYGEDWPEVQTIRAQIATLRQYYFQRGVPGSAGARKVDPRTGTPFGLPGQPVPPQSLAKTSNGLDLVDVYLASLNQELDSLSLREIEIERIYTVEFKRARELSVFLEQNRQFNDDLDRLHGLWSSIKVQASKVDIEKENLGYALKVIAPAKDQLSLKRVIKLYGAGIIVVMGLVCGLIFLREWTDTTLKSVDEIRASLPLPILGSVPVFDDKASGISGSPLQTALCYFHRPGSPEAEAYRSLRTSFLVTLQAGQRIIQVTSPEPGDGKSTLISNLAIAMAQSGKRVLLIDSDLRRPTLHTLFGMRRDIGVSEVLAGEIDLLTATQSTIIDGLSILTCGSLPSNPAETLASSSYSRMLKNAEREFDIVLVDTPPLLAVSDPCIVAPNTDGLVLVLRMGKNRRNSVRRATELIHTNNVRVIGVVCNGTTAVAEGYSYKETYGDYFSGPTVKPSSRPVKSTSSSSSAIEKGDKASVNV
ncbi:MAG: polysaccharide biosynthesis tyrosine autokinase [Planctomycetota bacterium]|nr:polysaccharide biosynthesis tyrosine autokinase [Planctomycetota bacterium]MDA1164079.1 polysaccharide biosynthesis tyrosine autokinase [Planctomycetota bacterium]